MRAFQDEIHRAVEGFVDRIAEIAQQAAIHALHAAFSRRRSAGSRTTSVPMPVTRQQRRRSPAELEQIAQSLVEFVRQNPGLRIEQINKALGTETKDLTIPLRLLIAKGTLATQGRLRSTTYHPANAAN